MREAGCAEVECNVWVGVFVPARTPAEIITPLNHGIVKVAGRPGVRDRLAALGFASAAAACSAWIGGALRLSQDATHHLPGVLSE